MKSSVRSIKQIADEFHAAVAAAASNPHSTGSTSHKTRKISTSNK